MQRLFELVYKYRIFFYFFLLEALCFTLIVRHNRYQGAAYFNSSNAIAGSILTGYSNINDYFVLKTQNANLALENAELRKELEAIQNANEKAYLDKFQENFLDEFKYLPAKVVSNSLNREDNYITLNIGSKNGVEPGMGVISTKGIVGQILSVSNHYSTVISMLHTDMKVSSQLSKSKTLCSTMWEGKNFQKGKLLFVPRHVTPNEGDKVVTSGFNTVFPEGIAIGTINSINTPSHESFHDIRLDLATDFSNLYFVYIVKKQQIKERVELEKTSEE